MSEASHFGVCIKNDGCDDIQVRRLYQILPDEVAEASGLIRIIDDSGEDYLFPAENFIPLPLPPAVEKVLAGNPAPNDPRKPERRPDSLIVAAWKGRRKILKQIIGDAITAVIVVGCATVVGFVVRVAPGATKERLQLFDAYHFYTIFGLSAFFTLILATEVAVTFIRDIRGKDSPDV